MNNLQGILLMVFSMLCFGFEDLMIKRMAGAMPTGQVILLLGFGGAVIFALMARARGVALLPRGPGSGILYLRTTLEGFCAIFMVVSLSLVPLSVFGTVLQASPLVITLGAALFLGETVGWRRWLAILAGFAGVLLIIRPGTEAFDPATLLVLAAVVLISARDLISRRLPLDLNSSVVAFQGFGALVISGPVLLLILRQPPVMLDGGGWLEVAIAVLFGVLGYYAIVLATRMGDASALAPFRYSRMVFTMGLGIVVLGERPGTLTYLGALLIIAAGLYTYLRERRIYGRMKTDKALKNA